VGALVTVMFSRPPNERVLWTMLLVAAGLAIAWRAAARRRLRGPTSADGRALRGLERNGTSGPA
jgi:hypothetical protein